MGYSTRPVLDDLRQAFAVPLVPCGDWLAVRVKHPGRGLPSEAFVLDPFISWGTALLRRLDHHGYAKPYYE